MKDSGKIHVWNIRHFFVLARCLFTKITFATFKIFEECAVSKLFSTKFDAKRHRQLNSSRSPGNKSLRVFPAVGRNLPSFGAELTDVSSANIPHFRVTQRLFR